MEPVSVNEVRERRKQEIAKLSGFQLAAYAHGCDLSVAKKLPDSNVPLTFKYTLTQMLLALEPLYTPQEILGFAKAIWKDQTLFS